MASAEAQPGRVRALHWPEFRIKRARGLLRVGSHPVVVTAAADLVALSLLLAALVAVYWPLALGIGIYAESDTFTFFYPVFAILHAAVRAGELPLWTPYIFGGFPLFAEGQIGALYPPSLAAALLPSAVDGFLALRIFHGSLAVLGMFLFARCLGASSLGAAVGGLAFGMGSFIVGQEQHANMLAATAWLPVLLLCLECALAVQGWIGHGLIAIAAVILGVQALSTHVQPLMLTGALMVAYVLVRQTWVACREVWLRGLRRGVLPAVLIVVDALAIVLFVGAVGALIAAIQILPLFELSQESWRASGWTFQDAVEYSLPPINLLTLIFPFFFRGPDGGQWSLWQIWEGVVYVGVIPLILAGAAVAGVRRWAVTFFAVAAVVSLIAALGGYAPFGLYEKLWHLPGMSLQRAPARFSLITTFSLAVLAAFGADWLAGLTARHRSTVWRRRRLSGVALGVLLLLAVLTLHLVIWHAWIESDRPWAMEALNATYIAQAHDPLQALDPLTVVVGLEGSSDLANPKTALPLAILGAFAAVLLAWRELPRLGNVWRVLIVALVAVDLSIFAIDFHPLVDVDDLGAIGPAGAALVERADGWRVLTRPEVQTLQPNELLPYGVLEASGYSPLELERHRGYATAVGTVDSDLLDLWSVRWIVDPARPSPLPSYRQVSFHPRRPLMIGGAGSPNGALTLDAGGEAATEIRLITALRGGEAIPDGATVAELTLTDTSGVKSVYPLRAGIEIADGRVRQPGTAIAHRPIETAVTIPIDDSSTARRTLGYASISLPRRVELASVDVRHVHRLGQTMLYGVAFFDQTSSNVEQLTREDRYREVYRDGDVAIYENLHAYPRAFVVPEAVVAPDGPTALAQLSDGPIDPRRQVVLEERPPGGTGPFAQSAPPTATILGEATSGLSIRASAPGGGFLVVTDAYYPGWQAYVDGEPAPILRADYLFRAVALPPGEHLVSFHFAPPSLERGTALSLTGLAVAASAAAIGFLMPLILFGARRARRAIRSRRSAAATSTAPDAVIGKTDLSK